MRGERVGAAHVGRAAGVRTMSSATVRGIHPDHPADDDAEVADGLRRHERVRRSRNRPRRSFNRGRGRSGRRAVLRDAEPTTLYSIGTVMRM